MKKFWITLVVLLMYSVLVTVCQAEGVVELSDYLNTDIDDAIAELGHLGVVDSASDDFDAPVTFYTEYSNMVQEMFVKTSSDFSVLGIRVGMNASEARGSLNSKWELTNQYDSVPYGEDRPETWYEYKNAADALILYIAARDGAVTKLSCYTELEYQIGHTEAGTAIISAYYGSDPEPTIPTIIRSSDYIYPLKYIGYDAFRDNLTLQHIVIPEGVTTIGGYAFSGCENLVSVALPSTIDTIEDGAFENCKSLTEINLPARLFYAGENVFKGCDSLTLTQSDLDALSLTEVAADEAAEAAFVVDEDNLVELSEYLGTDFYSFVELMDLSDDGATSGAQYSNNTITICSDYEKDIEYIELHRKANYCIEGVYVGMTQQNARMTLLKAGWKPIESEGTFNEYQDADENTLTFWCDSQRLVDSICLMMNYDTIYALYDEYYKEESFVETMNGETSEGYTTGDVNLRSGPGLDYSSLGVVPGGSNVSYLGDSAVDERGVTWYYIDYYGMKGWGSSKYVSVFN